MRIADPYVEELTSGGLDDEARPWNVCLKRI